MRKPIFLSLAFFSVASFCFGQSDTVLSSIISHPYYYNLIKDKDGTIYSGSSEGVQQWTGGSGEYTYDEKGYVELNDKGKLMVRSGGIKKYENSKFNYLLPYPNVVREEFYANTDQNLYIVTGGRLYIFDILPYSIAFRNHSIRTISNHYVGTYSGIYYDEKKIDYPPFTEGYIREIGDTGFVYFSNWMYLFYPDKTKKDPSQKLQFAIKETLGEVFDVLYDSTDETIYYFCNNGVYKTDKNGNKPRFIFQKKASDPLISVGIYENILQFCSGNEFWSFDKKNNKPSLSFSIPSKILSAIVLNEKYYLLTATELYAETTGGKQEKVADFTDAHTVIAINDKELVIATNFGLYTYNIETREKQLLIRGVEFNRRALFLKKNTLYAGSINGLYQIDVSQIDMIIKRNKLESHDSVLNQKWLIITLALFFIIVALILALLRERKKLKIIQHQEINEITEKSITADEVFEYIKDNLTTVSIKSINEHFNISTLQLYALLTPQKPGNIITDLRTEIVLKMRSQGKKIKEISESTGFSESYIYRIK